MKTFVEYEIEDAVARITFKVDPEGKPPTVDYDVLDKLEGSIDDIQARSEEIRAVVLRSASEKYFCVGANLKVLQGIDKDSIRKWVRRGHEVFSRIASLQVPVIAVVSGHAAGGGLELALSCDFILATDTAQFAFPEAGIGFVPGWGGSFRFPKIVGPAYAKELMFTGRAIDVRKAMDLGFVTYSGTREEVDNHLEEILKDIKKNSAISIAMIKELVDEASQPNPEQMRFSEEIASSTALASGDTVQRLNDFFDSRKKK